MRPTGLGHGVYKFPDYGVFCGEWCIGRIYETRTGAEEGRGAGCPIIRQMWALPASLADRRRRRVRIARTERVEPPAARGQAMKALAQASCGPK